MHFWTQTVFFLKFLISMRWKMFLGYQKMTLLLFSFMFWTLPTYCAFQRSKMWKLSVWKLEVLTIFIHKKIFDNIVTFKSIRNPSNGLNGLWMVNWKLSSCRTRSSLLSMFSLASSLPRGRLSQNWDIETLNSSILQAR